VDDGREILSVQNDTLNTSTSRESCRSAHEWGIRVSSKLERMSRIMDRGYQEAKWSTTNIDARRAVPVLKQHQRDFSGFNQGQGEVTIMDLLNRDLPKYSLLLIDEIESSLHPRTQRRLIRDLAERCREKEWQVIITTHSPYVLEELPAAARACIIEVQGRREIIYGVSPEFAMTKMDDLSHPECDLYVEDDRAHVFLMEILAERAPDVLQRCQVTAYGAASVGRALGQMVTKFKRPTRVFLDGDVGPAPGCISLPGGDAPEVIVFTELKSDWKSLAVRVGRQYAAVADACERAMLSGDHHEWIGKAASQLTLRGDTLWQVMCSEWAKRTDIRLTEELIQSINDALLGMAHQVAIPVVVDTDPLPEVVSELTRKTRPRRGTSKRGVSNAPSPLFPQWPDAEKA
jgi:predicted ATPase